ncbi:MAG TPA: FecR family protein [Candidatus Sulfopaludibacter sp.]|nr:FecR family protein [Candidatus Sulfopaludibacter sp.]
MKTLALVLAPVLLWAGQARYARLGEFEGPVEVQLSAADPWMPAERNLPLAEGAWIRTGADARVEIELEDGGVWRLGGDSQGEISDYTRLSTGQRVTLLSLDRGVAYFTGHPLEKDALSLAVPGAQVSYARRARVRLEAADTWSRIAVLEGAVKFSSPAAEIDIPQGTTTRVEPDNPDRFFLDREVPAMALDRWSADRDKAMAGSTSGTHVVEHYGLVDLDDGGQWMDTEAYGTVWKPKTADGWAPFQQGRWRWYGGLGYTWVSADAWGWLPYHYGRWAHISSQGWIWVPTISQVFKPGEVYWLVGAKWVGWGALAPGEQWTPPDQPDQFLNVNTTYAAFAADARAIDPAGFTARPKEPLAAGAFAVALPSPAFVASRLDATRPVLRAGSTRVAPVLRGVTYEDPLDQLPAPPPPTRKPVPARPQQAPVIVITPPAPAPEPEEVAVPVPYPVIAGLISPPEPARPPRKGAAASSAQPASTAASKAPATPAPPAQRPRKKLRDRGEGEIYAQVLSEQELPARQLVDLDSWTRRYRESDFEDDRTVLYMQAYSKTGHAEKVVELGSALMGRGLMSLALEPSEVLSVLYLTTVSAEQVPHPSGFQRNAFHSASGALLSYTPVFFSAERRPANLSEADWKNARLYMEEAARKVLATNR